MSASNAKRKGSRKRLYPSANDAATRAISARHIALNDLPSRQFDIFLAKEQEKHNLLDHRSSIVEKYKLRRGSSVSRQISAMDVDFISTVKNRFLHADQDRKDKTKVKYYLKSMNARMSVKRKIRNSILAKEAAERDEERSGVLYSCVYQFLRTMRLIKLHAIKVAHMCDIWKENIKSVHGVYGSGVAAYFYLIRVLLFMNLTNFVISFVFVVLPQLIYSFEHPFEFTNQTSSVPVANRASNLFSGSEWLSNAILYYGYYTNSTFYINEISYDLPFAYFATYAVLALINLAFVAYGIGASYHVTYIGSDRTSIWEIVFSSWDHSIESEKMADQQKHYIQKELLERLAIVNQVGDTKNFLIYTVLEVTISVVVNLFCLCFIACVIFFMYLPLQDVVTNSMDDYMLNDLYPPYLVSLVLLFSQYVLSLMGKFEYFISTESQMYVTLFRVAFMKCSVVCLLTFYWMTGTPKNAQTCMQSMQGVSYFRFIIANFVLTSVVFGVIGIIWKVVSQLTGSVGCRLRPPGFNLAFHINDLIYYQSLVWVGSFFSPLLPLLLSVVLVFIFYGMLCSINFVCSPRQKYWSSTNAPFVFHAVLLASFAITMFFNVYSLVAEKPSSICGPYRGHSSVFEFLEEWLEKKINEHVMWKTLVDVMSTTSTQVAIGIGLLVAVFYARSICVVSKQTVRFYESKVFQASKDKAYLLKRYEEHLNKKMTHPKLKSARTILSALQAFKKASGS